MILKRQVGLMLLLVLVLLAACQPENSGEREIRVALIADGTQRAFVFDRPLSVEQFLRQANITLNPLDEVTPSKFTQVTDGMTVTVVRVAETEDCSSTESLAFDQIEQPSTNLEPGETRILERGENGEVQICYTIIIADGVERDRRVKSRIVIKEPKNQIVAVGQTDTLEPVVIDGTLAYISSGQAWMIRGNSGNPIPLTSDNNLDGRVFDLSADGRQLLYTRQTDDPNDAAFSNELWVILDTNNPVPIPLGYNNILSGGWIPGQPYNLYYSSANAGGGFQGWVAYNDLWVVRLNPRDGDTLDIDEVITDNVTGEFAFWGTRFAWSPDGTKVAYAKSNGVGLINLGTGDGDGDFGPFALNFAYYNTAIVNEWVWQPTLSWSQDGQWVVTTVHGPSYSSEAPTDSIIFDIGVFKADGSLALQSVISKTGIWASPVYSPVSVGSDGQARFSIAFLQAREPLNSYGTEYDLMIADRDGSNPSRVFPPQGLQGIRPVNLEDAMPLSWSPSGQKIAVLYQKNLWIVDVESGLPRQITNDGQTSTPRWTN